MFHDKTEVARSGEDYGTVPVPVRLSDNALYRILVHHHVSDGAFYVPVAPFRYCFHARGGHGIAYVPIVDFPDGEPAFFREPPQNRIREA